jgi:quinolinate synthase
MVLRKNYPEFKIIVHPESKEELLIIQYYYGSTEYIYDMVKKIKKRFQIWGVGTEGTFVQRLATENPDKISNSS